MTISDRVARYIVHTQYEHLTQDAIDAAKRFMLDTMAIAWAGTGSTGLRELRDLLVREAGRPESTIWGFGDRVSANSAAFINSISSAALDYDALGMDSNVHVNVVTFPAALAAAQREQASGRDFLTALIISSDLMCRLGASCEVTGKPHKGWFYTSIHGVFAAAAAGAKLMRLDEMKTRHALGIAFSQASGTQQCMVEPALTKRMQSAFATRAGLFSAQLAQCGYTASESVFEGRYGLFSLYQEGEYERLLRDLGSRFENMNLSIKKYPSCGCNHAAIEATIRLVKEHNLLPEDIASATVTISPFMDRLVGGPFDPRGDPQVAAQFSVRYSIACAILRRKLTLSEIQPDQVLEPRIKPLIEKVHVVVDEGNTGKRAPVTVTLKTTRNEEVSLRISHVPGTPHSPLSQNDLEDKLIACTGTAPIPMSSLQRTNLIDRISRLEDIDNMNLFFDGIMPA